MHGRLMCSIASCVLIFTRERWSNDCSAKNQPGGPPENGWNIVAHQ